LVEDFIILGDYILLIISLLVVVKKINGGRDKISKSKNLNSQIKKSSYLKSILGWWECDSVVEHLPNV
jgi:hypothetical protein